MKLVERRKFIGLAVHTGHNWPPQLCNLCLFLDLGRPDEDGHIDDFDCVHPLKKIREDVFPNVLDGADCWAFRAKAKYERLADRMYEPPSIEQAEQIADDYLAKLTGEKFR